MVLTSTIETNNEDMIRIIYNHYFSEEYYDYKEFILNYADYDADKKNYIVKPVFENTYRDYLYY